MRVERLDTNSGAILFKKDKESRDLESVIKKVEELEETVAYQAKEITNLKRRMTTLEKKVSATESAE